MNFDVLDMVDISLSDKGKSDILEKFGEYTPDSIKKYLIEDKGATKEKANQAAKTIKNISKPQFNFEKTLPWALGAIAGILVLRMLGKK